MHWPQEWFDTFKIPDSTFTPGSDWHARPRIECKGLTEVALRVATRVIVGLLQAGAIMQGCGVQHRDIKVGCVWIAVVLCMRVRNATARYELATIHVRSLLDLLPLGWMGAVMVGNCH